MRVRELRPFANVSGEKKLFALCVIFLMALGARNAQAKLLTRSEPIENTIYKTEIVLQKTPIIPIDTIQFSEPDYSKYTKASRVSVPTYFETRNSDNPDVMVKMDGNYISAGPMHFHAAPGYTLESLLKSRTVRKKFGHEISSFGGIRAIQRNSPHALEKLQTMFCNQDFLDLYFDYAKRDYQWYQDQISSEFGIDIGARSEAVIGFYMTIVNNRRNDVMKVAEYLTERYGADTVNKMSDKRFINETLAALTYVLNTTLADNPKRKSILANYRATARHFWSDFGREYLTNSIKTDLTYAALEKYLEDSANALPAMVAPHARKIVPTIMRRFAGALKPDDTEYNLAMLRMVFTAETESLMRDYLKTISSQKMIAETRPEQAQEINFDINGIIARKEDEAGKQQRTNLPERKGLLAKATHINDNLQKQDIIKRILEKQSSYMNMYKKRIENELAA